MRAFDPELVHENLNPYCWEDISAFKTPDKAVETYIITLPSNKS